MKVNDGGSAFPNTAEQSESGAFPTGGMSLRDYFAAAALNQCLLAVDNPFRAADAAARAYAYADAMLAHRSSQEGRDG